MRQWQDTQISQWQVPPFLPKPVIQIIIFLIWLILFVGAAPTASLNGIAIAVAPPDASHYASSVQFAVQNLAKMMVPIFGGWLIDMTNLFTGFDITMAITTSAFLVFALLARRAAGIGAGAPTSASLSAAGSAEQGRPAEAPAPRC